MISQLKALRRSALLQVDQFRRSHLFHDSLHNTDIDQHLAEAAGWLKRAQDNGTDRGVSYGADFGGPWLESYPETTGYIIPTFLKLADYYKDQSYIHRAIEMGEWECEVQMESGAVMGGRVNPNPTPAVFNTGMVLLGWAALSERTGSPTFLASLRRACDWLLSLQEPTGEWRKGNSQFANANTTVYNVKAAWGLCEAGRVAGIREAIEAAVRNAEFCLSKQSSNGWFSDCCLDDASQPLLRFSRWCQANGGQPYSTHGQGWLHPRLHRRGLQGNRGLVLPDRHRADRDRLGTALPVDRKARLSRGDAPRQFVPHAPP